MEVVQALLDSQLKSLKTQLEDVGIRVIIGKGKKEQWLGYVIDFTTTMTPIKVRVRYNDGVKPLTDKQAEGFQFVLRAGRFILHKGK